MSEENKKLLIQSILHNGWTLPIVIRKDRTIVDGFHRYFVSGMEPLKTKLGGMVPVVIIEHATDEDDMYATITHNRAKGVHQLTPMKAIVQRLISQGKTVKEIGKQLGMKPEEVYRLSDFGRDEFLLLMQRNTKTYSKAFDIKKY